MRQLGVSRARTSAVQPSIWYDRTIPDEFRAELSPGGSFERLVRFAQGRHQADVQLRAVGSLSWATIYCGLTNVLHLEYRRKRGYRLRADIRHMTTNQAGPPEGILQWDHVVPGHPADGRLAGHRGLHDGAVQQRRPAVDE
jgi:hypothetical protein